MPFYRAFSIKFFMLLLLLPISTIMDLPTTTMLVRLVALPPIP
jgi:hypothetical protein